MTDEPKYRVGMVSKLTGLSTHTLRMWEKRYAAVVPHRTEAGGRLYTDADVERLRILHRLVQRGHSIGGIAKLPDEDLHQMATASGGPQGAVLHLPELRERVLEAIEGFRVEDAEHMLSRAALSTEPLRLLTEVVGPIMVEVGDRWERGELAIAQEHACSIVMRGLLFSLMRLYPGTEAHRRVVVTTPADEQHELGALMAAMLAAMHGWNVVYLGPNLPAEEVVFAAERSKAKLVMLSVTNLSAEDARREIRAIERGMPERAQLLIGGRAASEVSPSRAQIVQNLAEAEALLSS